LTLFSSIQIIAQSTLEGPSAYLRWGYSSRVIHEARQKWPSPDIHSLDLIEDRGGGIHLRCGGRCQTWRRALHDRSRQRPRL
jgi:hypothetical protein